MAVKKAVKKTAAKAKTKPAAKAKPAKKKSSGPRLFPTKAELEAMKAAKANGTVWLVPAAVRKGNASGQHVQQYCACYYPNKR